MTRRDIFKGLAALAAFRQAAGNSRAGTTLVVVRLVEGHSDLLMLRRGVELSRVRISVQDPEVMNDVELAGFIRLGLRGTGADDLPLFLADGVRMTGIVRIA
jgi:hypothetical protein